MANLSEDIQCAGSDTRPPMLDRTDFASWQQRIRLYCQGKENREKERYNADIRATNIIPQGLPKDIYTLMNHYTDANDIWDNVKMLLEEYFKDKMLLMRAQENKVALDEEQLLFIVGRQDNDVDEDVDEKPVQDLALNVDNMFQDNDCDAFDYDVDEAPTTQTMFMTNLSSVDLVYDEVDLSYDSDILSE
nr:integrase, catalytic region, zinc finger, CCHC-type, peptidase aspartic, catalytic [Tanacetum cinerariifolium]